MSFESIFSIELKYASLTIISIIMSADKKCHLGNRILFESLKNSKVEHFDLRMCQRSQKVNRYIARLCACSATLLHQFTKSLLPRKNVSSNFLEPSSSASKGGVTFFRETPKELLVVGI